MDLPTFMQVRNRKYDDQWIRWLMMQLPPDLRQHVMIMWKRGECPGKVNEPTDSLYEGQDVLGTIKADDTVVRKGKQR